MNKKNDLKGMSVTKDGKNDHDKLVLKLSKLTKAQLINCIVMDSAYGKWDMIISVVKKKRKKSEQ